MKELVKDFALGLTHDLTIDLCYLTLYRLGGVRVVAFAMLIEWGAHVLKHYIIPFYEEVKLKKLRKELDELRKACEDLGIDLSEETC